MRLVHFIHSAAQCINTNEQAINIAVLSIRTLFSAGHFLLYFRHIHFSGGFNGCGQLDSDGRPAFVPNALFTNGQVI